MSELSSLSNDSPPSESSSSSNDSPPSESSSSSNDSPPSESSENEEREAPISNPSTSSVDTESPPPTSTSQSPPPPPDSSPPLPDDSEPPPSPPPLQRSLPPPPPPSISPPPPSLKSSPPPPNPDSSPPPPPPHQDDKSSSPPPPPPEEEDAPSPPPSSRKPLSPPPSNDRSPPPPNAPSPRRDDASLPPPHPLSNDSSSVIFPSAPAPTIRTPNVSLTTSNTDIDSSPVKPSPPTQSKGSSGYRLHHSVGPILGLTFIGVLLALVAIFFVIVMRKKRKMESMYYRPPPHTSSMRPDVYIYSDTHPIASSSNSSSYYASQQMSSGASGILYESNRGYGHHLGPLDPHISKSCFTYEELIDITGGFAQENVIGEGGFGCVYKGVLPDGRRVAVKELKAGSGQGEREFRAEVEIISRVHHRHLVSLVGYCIADYHRLLVYEFVPNSTLEHHLHGKGLPVMEWSKRLKIAIGSARGLAYLHEDCHPRIIHRDIKSANILLDDYFEAQVADFGLAKLSNDTHTHVSTRVMGTFGYMAPEYASSGKLTDRSDVFSFGVVLLELITGRKPVDASQPLGDESLVEWARPLLVDALESGNCEGVVDPRLDGNYPKPEMFKMIEAAAACVRHSAPKRPRMVQVVRALDSDGDMPDLTNGVKVGQSQVFNSGQYSADIQKFRRMAFGSNEYDSSEYGAYSGEHARRSAARSGEHGSSRRADRRPSDFSSGEMSETSAILRGRGFS